MLIIVFKCRLCLWTTRLRVEVRDPQNREVVVLCVCLCVWVAVIHTAVGAGEQRQMLRRWK